MIGATSRGCDFARILAPHLNERANNTPFANSSLALRHRAFPAPADRGGGAKIRSLTLGHSWSRHDV